MKIWPFLSPPPAVFHMPSVEMLWVVRNRSADIAMDRVRAIVRIDRRVCGDGKWVRCVSTNLVFWSKVVSYAFGYRNCGDPMSLKDVCRHLKPHYRWEWRR